jgi:hypothetical protein
MLLLAQSSFILEVVVSFIDIIAFATGLFALCLTLRYCWLIRKHQVKPVLAMWIMFAVSVSLSFWTYMSTKNHSLMGNLGNSLDMIDVWLIFISILFYQARHQRKPNAVEIGCLAASALIAFFWYFTGENVAANLLLQLILVFAYIPAIKELRRATQQIECSLTWAATLLVGLGAIIPAIIKNDVLGIVYSARAILSVSLMLYYIRRLEERVRQNTHGVLHE